MKIDLFNEKRDLDYILSTYEELYRENVENFVNIKKGFENFKKDILYCKGRQNAKIFVILDNRGRPVGYIQCIVDVGRKVKEKRLRVTKIFVDKTFRKKGYGIMLMKRAKEFAKEKHCDKINLNTFPHNLKFYQKLGFEIESYWMKVKL